ncbi:MAG: diguanylate cyclase [Rhodopirellula sp.]|nr:diguanylate cyclase [Rhodopirellula sp.]
MPVQPRFHEGRLTVSSSLSHAAAIVRAGTSLLDLALLMEESEFLYAIVQDKRNTIVGIVSREDVTRYTEMFNSEDTATWQSRPVEDLMMTRLAQSPNRPTNSLQVVDGSDVACIPIVEQGQIVGVMTHNDVLMSWRRLEPALRAAGTDDVTQLANRTMFMRRLEEEWDRSTRNSEPLALFLFDVDFFKQVNDQCGHMAGDDVLAAVGQSVKDSLRSYDVVARIGGDEFAALCFNCDSDAIDLPIRRIQESMRKIRIPAGLQRSQLTLSIGAAVVRSGFEELSTDKLFSHADACLYRSKAAGRNRAFRILLDEHQTTTPESVDGKEYSAGAVNCILH